MNVECIECGKVFDYNRGEESESENTEHICYGCALTSITGNNAPEFMDMNTALFVSGEMSKEDWREMQAELRRYHPGDFITEEDEICERCGNILTDCDPAYDNHYCYSEADRLADEEDDRLTAFERLYDEALEEDLDRKIVADQEAQQAKWDAQIEEWERIEAERLEYWTREQEWNDSFVPILYDIFGWTQYDRFVAPILIKWLRLKKRWHR